MTDLVATRRPTRPAHRLLGLAFASLAFFSLAPPTSGQQEPTPAVEAAAPAGPPAAAQAAAAPIPCPEQAQLLEGISALLGRRPEDATLHFWRARAWAQCGDTAQTVAALAEVERFGAGFLPVRDAGFEKVWDDPAFRARYAALEAALPRVDLATEAFRVERQDLIPEGIAWDPGSRRLFVGSLATGEIVAVEATNVAGGGGARRPFAGPFAGVGQVLGLAVDAGRRRLYAVATSALVAVAGASPANAVLELDADSGAVVRRLDAAGAAQLNDVTVAPDGTLFASDSGAGGIWRATAADTALVRWPSAEVALGGANGIAVSAGGDALYVAHATGIARLELASGTLTPRIDNTTRETLAAIDGLYARGNTLIGVQNVTHPGRVVELTLDAAGAKVVAARTLLSHHHPGLAEPTTGAVDGDRFLLLANSYVGRLQPDGTIRDAATIAEPVVLAIPLAAGAPTADAPSGGSGH
jgi:sugar lactone lactonase YvrE